jgi:integrase
MPFTKNIHQEPVESPAFSRFLDSLEGMDWDTVKDYRNKLKPFLEFCKSIYGLPVDNVIREIKAGSRDRYEVLSDYKLYLLKSARGAQWSPNNLRAHVKKARNFLESNSIEFSDRQLKSRVKLPRAITRKKMALRKEMIMQLIKSAPDPYMRTFIMLLASTGLRPAEALSIRHRDLDLESDPGRVTIRPRFTKMRVERYTFLTQDAVEQIKSLLKYKHRERKLACKDKRDAGDAKETTIKKKAKQQPNTYYYHYYMVKLKPQVRPNDLLFAIYRRDETARAPHMLSLYDRYSRKLNAMLNAIGLDEREEDGNGRRHKISEYSFRRYVKSTISNAGLDSFGEWLIGHRHSPYWSVDDDEKARLFKQVEVMLTFLDSRVVEAQRATVESKLEASEQRYARLKEEWEREQKRQQEERKQLADAIREQQQAVAELRDTMERKLREREKKKNED